MIGTRVSHYEILEQLGQGGMGIVYKARDTQLDRLVALKFLSPHLSTDPAANARFIQEAKAASALDHANICSIHEIGRTDDGHTFICMPFYSGETLKYRMQRAPMHPDQVVSFVRQIALGLERAHEAGIVHRDIKPANIMVTDRNEIKILDFGVAKLGHGAGITQTGSTIGTVAYMSPEQASGGKTDARSDLWAVGVLMYEMLTGKRPFEGEYDQAVVYKILNQDPVPVSELDPAIPSSISHVVARLLEKVPEDRIQTAGELAAALSLPVPRRDEPQRERRAFLLGKSAWIGVAVLIIAAVALLIVGLPKDEEGSLTAISQVEQPAERATLAVLPFSNLRRDPETDFLGYALADQVIGSLMYVENLTVRPAGSVRHYQDGDYDVQQAGLSLGADYVMAGNYLQQGDQMRLTVELIDVDSREMIWREPIDLEYHDVFTMQDIVAQRLLGRLEVQFSEEERSRMQADVPADPLAYEYYLRALAHDEDREGNLLAIELLEKATALDSTFAPAWNQLGARLRTQGYWDLGGETITRRAKRYYERALRLNPDLLSALSNVALFYAEIGELDKAYEAAQRVLGINPNNAEGHFARSYVLRYAGLIDASVEEARIALASDTTNPLFRSTGFTFLSSGDYHEALEAFELSRVPGLREGWEGIILYRRGEQDRAVALLEKASSYDSTNVVGLWARSVLAAWRGDYDRGLRIARQWERANLLDGEGRFFVGTLFCLNRDYDRCLELLNEAADGGYYNHALYERDFFLEPIREMREFQELLRRVKDRSEAFRERNLSKDRHPGERRDPD